MGDKQRDGKSRGRYYKRTSESRVYSTTASIRRKKCLNLEELWCCSQAAMAFATRTAKTAASSLAPYHRIAIFNPNCRRLLSSSSSSSADYLSSTNQKMKKNNSTERLSAVIDAANDRKLPPQLRGQRNNVRYLFLSL